MAEEEAPHHDNDDDDHDEDGNDDGNDDGGVFGRRGEPLPQIALCSPS